MDYKEKLKEALNSDNTDYEVVRWIEQNFPELKESEDERIRKTISDILLIDNDEIREILDANNVLMQDIDAWLEKQRENAYNEELSKLLHKVICHFINNPDIPYLKRDEVSKKVIPYIENLEKQGKQKPVDKLEPNLNVTHLSSTVTSRPSRKPLSHSS